MEWSCHLLQKTPPRVPCLHLAGSVTVSSFVCPRNGEFTAAITANEASEQWSQSPPRRGQREARSSQIPLCLHTSHTGVRRSRVSPCSRRCCYRISSSLRPEPRENGSYHSKGCAFGACTPPTHRVQLCPKHWDRWSIFCWDPVSSTSLASQMPCCLLRQSTAPRSPE